MFRTLRTQNTTSAQPAPVSGSPSESAGTLLYLRNSFHVYRLHQLYQWKAMSYDYELSNDYEPVEDENDYNVEKDIVEDEIDDKEEIDENMTSNFQLMEPLEDTMEKSSILGETVDNNLIELPHEPAYSYSLGHQTLLTMTIYNV